jgi:hypothetical protein
MSQMDKKQKKRFFKAQCNKLARLISVANSRTGKSNEVFSLFSKTDTPICVRLYLHPQFHNALTSWTGRGTGGETPGLSTTDTVSKYENATLCKAIAASQLRLKLYAG